MVTNQLAACREEGVDPDWWVDPDHFESDFGIKRTVGQPTGPTAWTAEMRHVYWNQVRAKILCYGCPLLWTCRKAGWDEPYHVWGGLTPSERYKARKSGSIRPYVLGKTPHANGRQIRDEVGKLFLSGMQPEDVAATIDRTRGRTQDIIRALLAEARHTREMDEPWGTLMAPPKFSQPVSYHGYQTGRALWSDEEATAS